MSTRKCDLCKKHILNNDVYSSSHTCGVCNLKWKSRTAKDFCGNCGENKLNRRNDVCDSCHSSNTEPKGF